METRYGGAVGVERAAELYGQGWTPRQTGENPCCDLSATEIP
jgi:hypothetical protein